MRVCDKCLVPKPLYRTFEDLKDHTNFDICDDCYTILSDWMYNTDRKKENDPVEPEKNKSRRNK